MQTVIGNTGWLFADNIFRMVLGFAVGIWVTRYLGPGQFGLFNYALALVLLFSSLAQLGLDGIVVRNLVRYPAQRDEILGSAFVLKLIGGAVASGLALTAISMLRQGDQLMRLLVGITCLGLISQSFGTIDFWFQSQVQSKYSAMARITAYLLSSAAKVVLILCHAPLVAFVWAGVADVILGAVGLIVAYRTLGFKITRWRTSRTMSMELLHDSWPLILTELVIMIYMRVDRILVGEISGDTELGIYAVAALLAETLCLLPRSLASSLFPAILDAQVTGERLFSERLQQYYSLMSILAYGIAVPVTFLAGWGVPLLFGAPFAKASTMLIGLVWTGLFINLGLARSNYLTAMNWTRLHFVTDFLGCAVNLTLNILLIPRYGGMGAVAASFVGYGFAAYGTCFLFRPLKQTGMMMTKAILCPKAW